MTYGPLHQKKSASWWVENAAAEWSEDQAPFHTVGKLTLTPKSVVDAAACEGRWIDVTARASAAKRLPN